MNLFQTMSQILKPEDKNVTQNRGGHVTYATPLANILETADGYVVEAEMPGVAKEGLSVTVENGQLTLVGRRTGYASPGTTLYRESRERDFRRVFEIDASIDVTRIAAKIEQGVLKLTLPKAEVLKPRQITVN